MKRDELRDDVVARAWRDAMLETPPAAIDDAIRAAARRAAGAGPRAQPVAEAREPWRWWMPLAAAATIGAIAIGVIQSLPQDAVEPTVLSDATTARQNATVEAKRKEDVPSSTAIAPPPAPASSAAKVAEAPAPGNAPLRQRSGAPGTNAAAPVGKDATAMLAAKPAAAPAAPKEIAPAKSLESTTGEHDALRKQDAGSSAAPIEKHRADTAAATRSEPGATSGFVPSPPASPPLAAAPPPRDAPAPTAATGAVGGTQPSVAGAAPRAKTEAMPARAAPAPAAAAGASAAAEPQAMAVTPPDVFVAEIRRLLAAGDREGAVRELQRFRRTHADADARLPEELRAFAASVPR